MANFSTLTLKRSSRDIEVVNGAGQLGYILGRPGDFEAVANLQPKDGFCRALVAPFKHLRDAVAFIASEGVAL